jgi:hypothetical protein
VENAMSDKENAFTKAATEQKEVGFVKEFWYFLLHNKKWWLLPIVIILLLLGIIVAISGSAAAPFIYTLF